MISYKFFGGLFVIIALYISWFVFNNYRTGFHVVPRGRSVSEGSPEQTQILILKAVVCGVVAVLLIRRGIHEDE